MAEPIPEVEQIMAPLGPLVSLDGVLHPEHYNRIYEVVYVLLSLGASLTARKLVKVVGEILEESDGE